MVTIPVSHTRPIHSDQTLIAHNQTPTTKGNFNKLLNKEVTALKNKDNHIKPQKNRSQVDIKAEMRNIRKTDRTVQESYNTTKERIQSHQLDENGMKIALKDLAKQFENQINAILWHQILKKDTGSLTERLWSSERTSAFVKADDTELGEIGETVYEVLLEEMKAKQGVVGGQ